MTQPAPSTPPINSSPEDRLDSWKEIAAYLNRDITTVQRWEKREGMPVHRHQHDKKGSVYASRAELDGWARSRNVQRENEIEVASSEVPSLALPAKSKTRGWILTLSVIAGLVAVAVLLWLQRREYFWRSPIADAKVQLLTDFDGIEQGAAISPDGNFVAFLSDRSGRTDVWLTQLGSGQFHNLTNGNASELVNASVRLLGFSLDGTLVTYWTKSRSGDTEKIGIWAVPTLGGPPRPYLEGVAEYDRSRDGTRLAYHTPGPGDPLFVTSGELRPEGKAIFTAPEGLHSHFPLWSPGKDFLYFVQGTLPDKLDLWRISVKGGSPERITFHNARVSHPVFLDPRTLLYLSTDADGSGPWLYSLDINRRIPHRLTFGPDRYTSLSASADGRRLVLTLATPKRTLWRMSLANPATAPVAIPLTTSSGFSPRLGPSFLIYVSATGKGDSLWKLQNGTSTELWKGEDARIIGGPAVSRDGKSIAFSVKQQERTLLYTVQSDGTNSRLLAESLRLHGDPAWSVDGQAITIAAEQDTVPRLYRVPLDGSSPSLSVGEYATNPVWAPDGSFVLYSGADVGTKFQVKAAKPSGEPHPLPLLSLTRGARHVVFTSSGDQLVVLHGEIQHKDLALFDLRTGAERVITNLPSDFNIRDFDLSPDGQDVVLERFQDRSDIVLLELKKR